MRPSCRCRWTRYGSPPRSRFSPATSLRSSAPGGLLLGSFDSAALSLVDSLSALPVVLHDAAGAIEATDLVLLQGEGADAHADGTELRAAVFVIAERDLLAKFS